MSAPDCPSWCSGPSTDTHKPEADESVKHSGVVSHSDLVEVTLTRWWDGPTASWADVEVEVYFWDEPPLTVEQARQAADELAAIFGQITD